MGDYEAVSKEARPFLVFSFDVYPYGGFSDYKQCFPNLGEAMRWTELQVDFPVATYQIVDIQDWPEYTVYESHTGRWGPPKEFI